MMGTARLERVSQHAAVLSDLVIRQFGLELPEEWTLGMASLLRSVHHLRYLDVAGPDADGQLVVVAAANVHLVIFEGRCEPGPDGPVLRLVDGHSRPLFHTDRVHVLACDTTGHQRGWRLVFGDGYGLELPLSPDASTEVWESAQGIVDSAVHKWDALDGDE